MKNIPMRPKMTKEELEQVQEQFMRGESIIKSPENKPIKTKNIEGKSNVKMYNLAIPLDVHAKAKMLALMEGKSLAYYIISAVRKVNKETATKYSDL